MDRRLACLIAAIGFSCVMPPFGHAATLVGHWAFEGNGLDSSDAHIDATANGNVAYAPGIYGQAAQFDGAGDYFQIPNSPGIQLRSGKEFSVAAYVNPETLNQQNVLMHGLGCSTWGSWFLGVTGGEPDAPLSPGNFVFGVRTSSNTGYTAVKGKATAGEWAHVAVSYDGTTLRMYVNAELQEALATPLPFDSAESLYVGGDPGCSGRSWYTGLVDELYIFNRSVNENQVVEVAGGALPTWLKASMPIPADDTRGLSVAMPLFQWTKGDTAVFHNVYMGADPNLTEANLVAPRLVSTLYYHIPGLAPGTTYYWRVDEIEKDGATVHKGDVWSFVTQAATASDPSPADGANTASTSARLTWLAGAGAVQHHPYFGTDADAVAQGAAATDKGTLALADAFLTPGPLESLTTYFWRVDEIGTGGAVKTGPLWSFTTALAIDDFESYTDEEGSRIYETWIDGYTSGLNGSTVGHIEAPFAEQIIVHDANQSMPLDYNNIDSPYYSEAEREFASAQDWTADGADTMVLYVRGRLLNSPAPLYVVVEDASGRTGIIVHPDPAILNYRTWIEWRIPLSDLATGGVNMTRVKKMSVGVGDKSDPKLGGRGLIFVDDILLTRP